jgi:hypothetical protein
VDGESAGPDFVIKSDYSVIVEEQIIFCISRRPETLLHGLPMQASTVILSIVR